MYRSTGISSLLSPHGGVARVDGGFNSRLGRHFSQRSTPSSGGSALGGFVGRRRTPSGLEHIRRSNWHSGAPSSYNAMPVRTKARLVPPTTPSTSVVQRQENFRPPLSVAPRRFVRKYSSRKERNAVEQTLSPRQRPKGKRKTRCSHHPILWDVSTNDSQTCSPGEARAQKRKRSREPVASDVPVHVDDKLLPFLFGQGWSPKKTRPPVARGPISTPLRGNVRVRSAFARTPMRKRDSPRNVPPRDGGIVPSDRDDLPVPTVIAFDQGDEGECTDGEEGECIDGDEGECIDGDDDDDGQECNDESECNMSDEPRGKEDVALPIVEREGVKHRVEEPSGDIVDSSDVVVDAPIPLDIDDQEDDSSKHICADDDVIDSPPPKPRRSRRLAAKKQHAKPRGRKKRSTNDGSGGKSTRKKKPSRKNAKRDVPPSEDDVAPRRSKRVRKRTNFYRC